MTKSVARVKRRAAGRDGVAGSRQARAEQRREQLLEAALTLFSERGYRGTSVRDITRGAGVTEAVLYHYFASKADLCAAVLLAYAPFGNLGRLLEDVDAAPLDEALRRLGLELLRLIRSSERLVLTLLSEAPAEPDVARTLERFLSDVTTALGQFLVTRQAGGEIAAGVDTTAAARAFQGALFVHLLTTSLTPRSVGPERDEETVAGLVTVLLRGMAPREEPSFSKSDAHRETVS